MNMQTFIDIVTVVSRHHLDQQDTFAEFLNINKKNKGKNIKQFVEVRLTKGITLSRKGQ